MIGIGYNISKRKAPIGGNDPAIKTLLAQASSDGYTAFSGDTLAAANVLVASLKSSGVWDKLDIFYVFATNGDANFALYNWKDPSSFKITNEGNTFTSLQGFTGDATNSYSMLTGWDAPTNGVNYQQDSASFGVWVRTSVNDSRQLVAGASDRVQLRSGSSILQKINTTNNLSGVFNGARTGLFHINRASSTEADYIYNGTSDLRTASSTILVGSDVTFFSATFSSASQISIGWFGGDLSSEKADMYNSLNTYLTSIGSI